MESTVHPSSKAFLIQKPYNVIMCFLPERLLNMPELLYLNTKGFPGGSDSKESMGNVGGLGSIPGLGRSPGEEHDNPLQYSCLENPKGQRSLAGYSPWGLKELDTQLSD